MRLKEKHFNVPFAAFEDDFSPDTFRLLIFLFSRADFSGSCSPGYSAMKKGAEIASDATIRAALVCLMQKGWIFHIKPGGSSRDTIWLQVPPRLRKTAAKPKKLLQIKLR